MISELNDLLMLHDERARVASGEVLSNIVALIPRYGVSALLLELPEAWRRALVTWLVEAYDNTYPIEDFEGIHNPGVREQIQGARAWMEVDSSYRDYIVNDVAALHAMTNDRLYSRHDLMHQLVRLAAQRGAAPTPSFEREATLPLAHRAFALGWAHDAVPSPADELLHIARVSDLSDIRPEDKQHLAGPPSPARCVVGPA